MKKPILRGYAGSIFFEYVLQDRAADAVIILPGFPSGNNFEELINFFFERKYHVFVPRYRGMYQSLGVFMSKNPVDDVLDFMEYITKGKAKSLWDNKFLEFKINKKILVGSSFGGAIALGAAAKNPIFSHIILAAPVWDFHEHNKDGDEQDLNKVSEFVQKAYKNCYRYKFKNLTKKMMKFEELKPEYYVPQLEQTPILVMHDTNDSVVKFSKSKDKIALFPRGTLIEHYLGHKIGEDMLNAYWKEIDKFIKINYVE